MTHKIAKSPGTYRLVVKTITTCMVVMGTNVMGNYALKRGLSHTSIGTSWSPLAYIGAFSHPWVIAGVLFMLAWLITRLTLLSWADLSYVLPVCSFSYVLSVIVGGEILGERISRLHWLGTCVVTLGVALTVLTPPETNPQPSTTK